MERERKARKIDERGTREGRQRTQEENLVVWERAEAQIRPAKPITVDLFCQTDNRQPRKSNYHTRGMEESGKGRRAEGKV